MITSLDSLILITIRIVAYEGLAIICVTLFVCPIVSVLTTVRRSLRDYYKPLLTYTTLSFGICGWLLTAPYILKFVPSWDWLGRLIPGDFGIIAFASALSGLTIASMLVLLQRRRRKAT